MPTDEVKFSPGTLAATAKALGAMRTAGDSPMEFICRHIRGDWGDMDREDRQTNDLQLMHGGRIMSAYTLSDGTPIWVITEADRSTTTLLLPEEY